MTYKRKTISTVVVLLALMSAQACARPIWAQPLPFAPGAPPQLVLTLNPSLSPTAARLLENTSGSFTATLMPAAGHNQRDVTAQVRAWISSNPAVATIDDTGHLTAKAPGSTTITAVLNPAISGSAPLEVTVATPPVFTNQPADTNVSAVIDSGRGVKVKLLDNLSDPLPGQAITMAVGTNPPGTGTLSGTLTQTTDAGGSATFNNLKIDWLGQGYTLVASASPSSGPVSATSVAFDELRVGDPCLGPDPACSSGCPDSDNDGLNDAWEIAGGIDMNGDGKIDAQHDVLLPGADPNKPDVYLKYDYMVATTTSALGTPPHSHQPPDAAIQQVVEAFASHGVTLHLDPQHDAIPEVQVTTLDPNPATACAGTDFVTMQALRQQHFGNRKWAHHYGVFAHNAVLPDTAADGTSCPKDPECAPFFPTTSYPDPTSAGAAEVLGADFIVAFGYDLDIGNTVGVETWASTFMHELGHNFGLKHGSLAAPAPQTCFAHKPNYLSVMDYLYSTAGIAVANQPGSRTPAKCNVDSDCATGTHCTDDLTGIGGGNVCYRVDYSREKLLDLNEAGGLNETLGVGGPAWDTDIVTYCASFVGCTLRGASNGSPIDWNNDGTIETAVTGDIDNDGSAITNLLTANDWEIANGSFKNLNFKFQCTSAFNAGNGAPSFNPVQSSITTPEPGHKHARGLHILHPPAAVSLTVEPSCANPGVKPHAPGTTLLALLGSETLDVTQVDIDSIRLHGAAPANFFVQDVNDDGIPDLLLEFRGTDVQISPDATHLRVTGWLKNSRAFVAEAEIEGGCRNR